MQDIYLLDLNLLSVSILMLHYNLSYKLTNDKCNLCEIQDTCKRMQRSLGGGDFKLRARLAEVFISKLFLYLPSGGSGCPAS